MKSSTSEMGLRHLLNIGNAIMHELRCSMIVGVECYFVFLRFC